MDEKQKLGMLKLDITESMTKAIQLFDEWAQSPEAQTFAKSVLAASKDVADAAPAIIADIQSTPEFQVWKKTHGDE